MKMYEVKLELFDNGGAIPSKYEERFSTIIEVQNFLQGILTQSNAEEIRKAKITEIEIIKELKIEEIEYKEFNPVKKVIVK